MPENVKGKWSFLKYICAPSNIGYTFWRAEGESEKTWFSKVHGRTQIEKFLLLGTAGYAGEADILLLVDERCEEKERTVKTFFHELPGSNTDHALRTACHFSRTDHLISNWIWRTYQKRNGLRNIASSFKKCTTFRDIYMPKYYLRQHKIKCNDQHEGTVLSLITESDYFGNVTKVLHCSYGK